MKKHKYSSFLILIISLFLLVFLSIRLGSSNLTTSEFFGAILKKEGFETQSAIIYALRAPRMLAALLAGVGLSISGVLLQAITNNPLAGPNIIGVNAGAGFSVLICLVFFPTAIYAISPAAFLGAFMTTVLIIALSQKAGSNSSTIILAGIACSSIFQAGISFLCTLDTDAVVSYTAFSVGGFAGVTMEKLYIPAIFIILSLVGALIFSAKINALCLGDSLAKSLGIKVKTVRICAMIFASLSAAAVVSFAGLLGFIGLMVPHITRKITGANVTRQLILAPVLGGNLVLVADILSRILLAPTEIPVGVITALAGAPFFLILLLRKKERIYA